LPFEVGDFRATIDFFLEFEIAEDLVFDEGVVAEIVDGEIEECEHATEGTVEDDELGAVEGGLMEVRNREA